MNNTTMHEERDIIKELRKAEELGYFSSTAIETSEQMIPEKIGINNEKYLGTIGFTRDFTEEKHRGEVTVNGMFDYFNIALVVFGKNNVIFKCNQAFEDLSGYQKNEVEKIKYWYDFISKKDKDYLIEQFNQYKKYKNKKKNDSIKYDCTFLSKDESIKSVRLSINKFLDRERWYVSFFDITDIKKEEVKYHQFYESMDEGVALHKVIRDTSGIIVNYTIIDINPSFETILGLKRKNIIGKNATEAYHVEKAPYIDVYAKVVESKHPTSFETYFPPMDKHFRISVISTEQDQFATIFTDITDPKKIEHEIQNEKKLIESIISALPGTFYMLNAKGRWIRWNENINNVSGYTSDELSDLTAFDLIAKDDRELIAEKIKECLTVGTTSTEARLLTKDGRRIPFLFTARSLVLNNDTYIIGTGMDISQRKKAEDELRKFKTMSDNVPYGVAIADFKGNISYINRYFANVHGYQPNELIGKNLTIFHNKKQLEKVMKISESLTKNKQFGPSEIWHIHKNGAEFPMLMSCILIHDINDKKRIVALSAIDITEQKKTEEELRKSEEKFRSLFDSSRDAIMTVTPPNWKFTTANPATLELFNVKDVNEFTSLGPFSVSPKMQPDGMSSLDKANKMISKAMDEGYTFFQWTHKRYDGKTFPATVLLTRVEIEKGKPFLLATVRDITEQVKAENDLKEKLQELEKWKKITVGRELKMFELKKKIEELEGKQKLGYK
jgi:PAS domain S-box-containing protein